MDEDTPVEIKKGFKKQMNQDDALLYGSLSKEELFLRSTHESYLRSIFYREPDTIQLREDLCHLDDEPLMQQDSSNNHNGSICLLIYSPKSIYSHKLISFFEHLPFPAFFCRLQELPFCACGSTLDNISEVSLGVFDNKKDHIYESHASPMIVIHKNILKSFYEVRT